MREIVYDVEFKNTNRIFLGLSRKEFNMIMDLCDAFEIELDFEVRKESKIKRFFKRLFNKI